MEPQPDAFGFKSLLELECPACGFRFAGVGPGT